MTEKEEEAWYILRKKKIKSAAKLSKEMGITRQRADFILKSLKEKGMAAYVPSQWLAK